MSLPRGQIQIIVRPSLRGSLFALSAYVAGLAVEGRGDTVQAAIADLLVDEKFGKIAQRLERDIDAART